MGKTAKWFRSLLGSKKSPPPPSREKKKSEWALSKSADYKFKNEDSVASPYGESLDASKHAIAVAAATAAVAEAALAAAQAAAEVVRLTSSAGSGRNVPAFVSSDKRRVAAVVKIQSAFRAYLARRAIRALKGLVKLQALVRGRIVRRQSADMLHRMQAMARIQARASAHRFCISDSSNANIKFSYYPPSGVLNPRNYYHWPENAKHGGHSTKQLRASNKANIQNSHVAPNSLNQWIEQYAWNNRSRGDDKRSDKILAIDTWKPCQTTRRSDRAFSSRNETGQEFSKASSFSRLSAKLEKPNPTISSEDQLSSITSQKEVDHVAVWTAESSPRAHSASSRPTSNLRGMMFTPTRSECSRSLYGDYLSHPSYMPNTESSKAKVRSQSVPKQRMMELNELGLSSTFGQNMWESDAVSEKSYALPHNYVKRQVTHTPISSSYGHRY